jgi:hypothetical protein
MIKQLQQHQAQQAQQQVQLQQATQQQQSVVMNNSPKRNDITGNHRQQILTQQVIHQPYGVGSASAVPNMMIAQYQQQQSLVTNLQQQLQSSQLRQLSSSSVIPSSQSPVAGSGRNLPTPAQCLQMSYYSQANPGSPQPPYFGDVVHTIPVSISKNYFD